MIPHIPAIPTSYEGVEYRSRLEARWACMFRLLGWTVTYEPFEQAGWIPDFVVRGRRNLLVEVKPSVYVNEALFTKLENAADRGSLLFVVTEAPTAAMLGRVAEWNGTEWVWYWVSAHHPLGRMDDGSDGYHDHLWDFGATTDSRENGFKVREAVEFKNLWDRAGNEIHGIRTWGIAKPSRLAKRVPDARYLQYLKDRETDPMSVKLNLALEQMIQQMAQRLPVKSEEQKAAEQREKERAREGRIVVLYALEINETGTREPVVEPVEYERRQTTFCNSDQPDGLRQIKFADLPKRAWVSKATVRVLGRSEEETLSFAIQVLGDERKKCAEAVVAYDGYLAAVEEAQDLLVRKRLETIEREAQRALEFVKIHRSSGESSTDA